jgi:hypothetical protein
MTPFAHVAGFPVEETIGALVPVLGVLMWALPRPRLRRALRPRARP